MAVKTYTYLRHLFPQPSTPVSTFSFLSGQAAASHRHHWPALVQGQPHKPPPTPEKEKSQLASLRELHMGRRLDQLASLTSTVQCPLTLTCLCLCPPPPPERVVHVIGSKPAPLPPGRAGPRPLHLAPTPYLSVRGQAVFPFFLLPSALYHRLCGLPNATTHEAALRCTIPCEDYQSSFIGPTLNDKNSVKTLKWTETGT